MLIKGMLRNALILATLLSSYWAAKQWRNPSEYRRPVGGMHRDRNGFEPIVGYADRMTTLFEYADGNALIDPVVLG